MTLAASNTGGGAGIGMGLGAGAAVAQVMATHLQTSPAAVAPASSQTAASKFCTACGHSIPQAARFCPDCGKAQQ